MFQPGFDNKGLDHASFLGSVFEYSPSVSAVPTALPSKRVDYRKEWLAIARIDSILNRDHNGTTIIVDLVRKCRCRPMQRGRQVSGRTRLQLPAPCRWQRDNSACGGQEMRRRQSDHPGDLSPERTAQGQSSKEGRNKYCKSAAAHPVWKGELSGDVEACYNRNPGPSGDDTRGQCDCRLTSKAKHYHRDSRTYSSCRHQTVGPKFCLQPR